MGKHSIRLPNPNPLRNAPPTLPHLAHSLLRSPRLPNDSPAPSKTKTPLAAAVSDPLPKRPISSERVCEVRESIWDSLVRAAGWAVLRDSDVCCGGGVVLAGELG